MARYSYIPNRVIDTNGIADGASIYFLLSGTDTPISIYSDDTLTTRLPNPYIVEAGAAVPPIYYAEPSGTVRVRVVSSGGITISDDDPAPSSPEDQAAAAEEAKAAAEAAAVSADAANTAAQEAETNSQAAQAAAETARDQAAASAISKQIYPVAARTNIPRGAIGTGAITGGTGGTNGTFALAFSGGNFDVNPTGTFTVAGGAVTAISLTGPGLYIGASPAAPTLSFAASSGLTGAAATLTVGYLVGGGEFYYTPSLDEGYTAQFQNVANVATLVEEHFDPLSVGAAAKWAEGTEPGGPGTYSSKEWAETAEDSVTAFDDLMEYVPSDNLYNPATMLITGKYIAPNGSIGTDPAWSFIYIAQPPNTQLAWQSNTERRAGSMFMTSPTATVAGTYSNALTPGGLSLSRTIPASGAAAIGINLKSNTIPAPTEMMVNLGPSALPYSPWHAPIPYVKESRIYDDVPEVLPDYVISVPSNNLYDRATMLIEGKYIASNGTIATLAGWSYAEIPLDDVDDLENIAWASNALRRVGATFLTAPGTVMAGTYINDINSPGSSVTRPKPVGATHLGINIKNAAATGIAPIPEPAETMVNIGTSALPYEPPGDRQMIDAAYLNTNVAGLAQLTLSDLSGPGSTLLAIPFGDGTLTQALSPFLSRGRVGSDVFNYHSAALDDVVQTVNGTDDVAPARIFGTTIGANHGWVGTNITKTGGHNKTVADFGQILVEDGVQWRIWDVPSSTVVTVTAVVGNAAYTGTTLTYVSGGTDTSNITATSKATTQIYPAITNHRKSLSVDGVAVEGSGIFYPKKNFTVAESYKIPDKDTLVAGAPVDRAGLSQVYRFDMYGGSTIAADFLALDAISQFQDLMFLQSYRLAANGGVLQYLIPDTLPFTEGGVDYDFTKPQDMTPALVDRLFITPDRIADPDVWPSHVIQINGDLVKATGFLPLGVAAYDVRPAYAASYAVELRESTKKIYMYGVKNPSTTSLAPGAYFGSFGFETYCLKHANRTACVPVEGPDADWLIVHWHASIVDEIELDPRFQGRRFEVSRQTAGVTPHGTVTTSVLRATVVTSGGAGQYGIFKFPHNA